MKNKEALAIMQRIQRTILCIEQMVEAALQENADMAVSPEVAALIAKFDTATDLIAARIQKLINASTTLSAEDQAALQSEVDKLNLLGQDPANPVPPVTTQP
jgi:hypothetical protein